MNELQLATMLFDQKSLGDIIQKLHHDTSTFLNKSKLNDLFMHLLLVLEGYRDGYLIDGCSVTLDNVHCLLQSLTDSFSLVKMRLQSRLVIIALGHDLDDFLVIKSCQLQRKLSELFLPVWTDAPIVVDINGTIPYICNEEETQSIKRSLQETFREMLNPASICFPVVADEVFDKTVGFPFVAGWLLGYPFVYRFTNLPNQVEQIANRLPLVGNALSMICLRKISVRANISLSMSLTLNDRLKSAARYDSKCRTIVHTPCRTITLFEYSLPVELINEVSDAQSHLNSWLERKENKHKSMNLSISNDGYIKLVDSCSVGVEDITSVSLIV